MNSAITTLSLLASMDGAKSTIFENYIPLIKYVAITHNMTFYDESLFHNLFMSEFQLDLPSYVLQYILTKSMNMGMIKKDKGRYRFTDKALKDDRVVPAIDNHRRDFASNITELTGLYNEFSKAFKDYNKVLVTDDFERIVYANTESTYNHAYRDKIVHQNSVKKLSSQVEDDYVYARFIEQLSQTNTYMFNTIIDISFGYSVSELLFCPEFDNHVDFKGLDCYFDTRIIMYLLGAEGSYYHDSMNKLLSALHKTGARLHIFKHTYEEILNILQICLKHWDDYDPYIAPSTLVHFKRNRKPKTDLEIILRSVENALARHNIDIVAAKLSDEHNDLKTKITQWLIKRRNSHHLFEESSAERDARSIISVLIDRDKLKPMFLKDAKSIFITSSITLIECLTQFEYVEDRHIAPCHSDMFIGSLLWLLNRGKYEQINKSLFAAIATSLNSLNKSLFERFTIMFKAICQKENVDEALIQSFLQDRVLHDILANHTLNNIDRLTAEEVERIKDEYIKQLKDEEIQKTEQVTQERDDYRCKYESNKTQIDAIRKYRKDKVIECKRQSSIIAKRIVFILRPLVFILDFIMSGLAAYFLGKVIGNSAFIIAVILLLIVLYLITLIDWVKLIVRIRGRIIKIKIKRLNKTAIPEAYLL